MVGVVRHHLLSDAEDDLQNLALGEAGVQKRLHRVVIHVATVSAPHLRVNVRSASSRALGSAVSLRSASEMSSLPPMLLAMPGVCGDAPVAFVLHVDRLPDNGDLVLVESWSSRKAHEPSW